MSYTRYTTSLAVACVTAGPRIVRTIGIVRLWFSNTISCTKSQTVYTSDFPFEPTGSNLLLKHILIPGDEKYFRFFIDILFRPKKDVSTVFRLLRSQGEVHGKFVQLQLFKKVDNTIHRINLYPVDSAIGFSQNHWYCPSVVF